MRRTWPVKLALVAATLLALWTPAGAGTLYVTNTKSASVSIIDTDTFEVTGTIALGAGKPNRVVFHPDGRTAWVVYDKSHDLGVIDAEARKLVKRVKIGGNPYNLAFTADGRHLLVLDWGSDTSNDEVIFYDLKTEKIDGRVEVSTWPAHAILSRDGKRLYVSGETAGDVTVVDVAARSVAGRLVHGGGDAMGLALTADGRTLYAAAGENKRILKIDTATNKSVGEIGLPGVVHEATLTLDGRFLYTTLRKANKVVVIRTADDAIVATIPQKGYPDLVTMEPTGRFALVTNRHADQVTVIDLASHTQARAIPVGKAPHGMALRPVATHGAR
jgi:YVTN family beta-propeller protein